MQIRTAVSIGVLALVVLPFAVHGQETEPLNAGLVQGVWFSEEPFFAGDTVRIFTAVHNQTNTLLRGTLTFFDNNTSLDTVFFSIQPQDIERVSIDWDVSAGEHAITTRIAEVRSVGADGTETDVVVYSPSLASEQRLVDIDTDGDNIGNRNDTDDDNDGIADSNDPQPLVAHVEQSETVVAADEDTPSAVVSVARTVADAVATAASTTKVVVDAFAVRAEEQLRDTRQSVRASLAQNQPTEALGASVGISETQPKKPLINRVLGISRGDADTLSEKKPNVPKVFDQLLAFARFAIPHLSLAALSAGIAILSIKPLLYALLALAILIPVWLFFRRARR